VISARTDVYGLGVLAYHLLTGKEPYIGDTPQAIILAIAESEPVAPRLIRADLPEPAEATLLKAMARDMGERFESTGAFAAALAASLDGVWPPRVPRPNEALPTQASGPLPTVTPPMHIAPIIAPIQVGAAAAGATEIVSPAPRRRPWLAVVGIVVLVAVLTAGTALFLSSRTTATGQPLVLTGCVAIAGLGDVAGMRFYDHQTGSGLTGLTDSASTCLKGLPMPADGDQYNVWLVDTVHEQHLLLGILTQSDGDWTLTYPPTGSAQGGVNLLGRGDTVEITLEQGQVLSPIGHVEITARFPADVFVHILHLLYMYPTTPGHQGLLVGLLQQAQALRDQAGNLKDFAQRKLGLSALCAAQNIVNIIEGKHGRHYHPLSSACAAANRDITRADDGYGLISDPGYLKDVADHAGFAATAPGATLNIKNQSNDVVTAVTNMKVWAQKLDQDALSVLQRQNFGVSNATDAATLAYNIVFGTDANGNGTVDDVLGESGLVNAYTHGQLMAFLPFD
jgi:hypothetical protein